MIFLGAAKILVSEDWVLHILCKYHLFYVMIEGYYPKEEEKEQKDI
ncbi:hypothetical protein GGQ57_001011 [Parabacteroides faecis]|uniref:Uncharacterized protein n=1 Tax=Parabacteroides faecis TaxID=1217282 RepID=A0ABR6KJL2_9BACT|nr:hypothetical protein [Parabacteroides faecis]